MRRSERGAGLPETAIVMMALLLFMFGVIDFGRGLYTYSFVANAARQGARWAIVRGSQSCTNSNNNLSGCNAKQSDVVAYVQSLSNGATDPSQIGVTPTWTACGNAPGCVVSVKVTYPFKMLGPLTGTLNMSSTSQMVISQ
ncbi:MAG TPA: TadE/TadG family type IV pilus assembly protein [Candidatus Dormibacteraeota bacterium]|nr:TadE/TadG family type IV pilus assembly protein [Candidatus Dormibacteraeota bacterium]